MIDNARTGRVQAHVFSMFLKFSVVFHACFTFQAENAAIRGGEERCNQKSAARDQRFPSWRSDKQGRDTVCSPGLRSSKKSCRLISSVGLSRRNLALLYLQQNWLKKRPFSGFFSGVAGNSMCPMKTFAGRDTIRCIPDSLCGSVSLRSEFCSKCVRSCSRMPASFCLHLCRIQSSFSSKSFSDLIFGKESAILSSNFELA